MRRDSKGREVPGFFIDRWVDAVRAALEGMKRQRPGQTESGAVAAGACGVVPASDAANPLSAIQGVELFTEGDVLYAAMLASIRNAQRVVRMESYLFASDEVGREFVAALAERARAGVEVRLHLDAAGVFGKSSSFLAQLVRERCARVKWFHRWTWRRPMRYNRRNHRKLLVVDDRVAYVGGFNIHRESSRRVYGDGRWRDTHALVSGGLVLDAEKLFDDFWHGHRRWAPTQGGSVSLASNHTRDCRHRIRCLYSEAFAAARQHIYLTTPYFVPDLLMQQRLIAAARRGVDVRLLVPSQSDVPLTRWAARAFYAALIAAGVQVYEYLPRMLHAKTVAIDGQWAMLGTANFDYRSYFLNYELVLSAREPEFCALLEGHFNADLSESLAVTAGSWTRRRWPEKLLEFIGWTMRRWL